MPATNVSVEELGMLVKTKKRGTLHRHLFKKLSKDSNEGKEVLCCI